MGTKEFEQVKNDIDESLCCYIDSIYEFCDSVNMVEFLSYSSVLSWIAFDAKKGYQYMSPLDFEYFMGVFLSIEYDESKIGKGSIKEIGEILDSFKSLVAAWKLSNSFRKIQGQDSEQNIANALFEANLISVGGTMRGYSHYSPSDQIDIDLLTPYNQFLYDKTGFNITDIGCFHDAIIEFYSKKSSEIRQKVTEQITSYKSDNEIQGIEIFAALHDFSYNDILFFSIDDIVAINQNINRQKLQGFLDYFSVVPNRDFNSNYRFFNDNNVFKERPIIKIGNRYLIINIQMILWCLRDRFEETLKTDTSKWEKYNKNKSDYLEDSALAIFRKMLPTSEIYSSLYYTALDGKRCELDGLVKYDNCILLIEAKSGIYNKSARRGGVKRLKNIIKDNIEYAAFQSHRAKEFIEKTENPFFENENKKVILRLEKNNFENIYLINVTMEYFAELAINLKQLHSLGYYIYDVFPWSVSLSDLSVICDFIQFPNQFLHYIYFREKFNNKVFVNQNFKHFFELDLFGFYLFEETEELDSFFIDDANESIVAYNFHCGTELDIDTKTPDFSSIYNAYYNNSNNKPIELPHKKYNSEYYRLVRQLEKYCDQGNGHTNFAIKLLDVDNHIQNQIISVIHEMMNKTLRNKRAERKSIPFLHGNFDNKATFGITIITGYQKDGNYLIYDLKAICIKNRYQYQYTEWLGLCCFVDYTENLVNNFVFVRDDTQSDIRLDAALKDFPKKRLRIGRNSPCPCNSGKKYKKCCGN